MELAACKPLLLLTLFITFFNFAAFFCDARATNFVNQNNAKSVEKDKGRSQTRIPIVDYTSRVEPVEYPYDPYGVSLVGDQDGVQGGLLYNGYPQGSYGGPSYGYGYGYGAPYQGPGIFGFPRGLFGFPRGLFGFPRGILGLPRIFFGYPGGGYGGNPGGYGANPGGYGGIPGGYGSGLPGLGSKPGDGGYPGGAGAKAEVKNEKQTRESP